MTRVRLLMDQRCITWGEVVQGLWQFENDSEEALAHVNALVARSWPSFVLTEGGGGQTHVFGEAPQAGQEAIGRVLAPGASLEERFASGSAFVFPHAGTFELRARCHWFEDGQCVSVESEPVLIEVLPTRPRALCLASSSGAVDATQLNAAWIDSGDTATLWLTSILALAPPRAASGVALGPVAADALPVLSVPNLRSPRLLTVAWVDGMVLRAVVQRAGQSIWLHKALAQLGHRLLAPLFETETGADALTMHVDGSGWVMTVAALDVEATDEPCAVHQVHVPGPAPRAAQSVHAADGRRLSVFFRDEIDPRGRPAVVVGISVWDQHLPPALPVYQVALAGRLLAHDFVLRSDNTARGGALMVEEAFEAGRLPRLVLHRWRAMPDGDWQNDVPLPLAWDTEVAVAEACLRLNLHGTPSLMLRGASGPWHRLLPDGRVVPVPAALSCVESPLDGFWIEAETPALFFTLPGSGLQLGRFGPDHRPISPNGG